jgi:hypothetical protein
LSFASAHLTIGGMSTSKRKRWDNGEIFLLIGCLLFVIAFAHPLGVVPGAAVFLMGAMRWAVAPIIRQNEVIIDLLNERRGPS